MSRGLYLGELPELPNNKCYRNPEMVGGKLYWGTERSASGKAAKGQNWIIGIETDFSNFHTAYKQLLHSTGRTPLVTYRITDIRSNIYLIELHGIASEYGMRCK